MQRLRNIGLKLTPQRLAILHYLDGSKEHPSAETIYKALIKKFPSMSLATVYNTLEHLKKSGSITELTIDPDKKHFDSDTSAHTHLMCISCKRIIDVHERFNIALPKSSAGGFEVMNAQVRFYGLCPACKKEKD